MSLVGFKVSGFMEACTQGKPTRKGICYTSICCESPKTLNLNTKPSPQTINLLPYSLTKPYVVLHPYRTGNKDPELLPKP